MMRARDPVAIRRGRGARACACAVAAVAAAVAAPAAIASTALVAKGQAGSFPWRLRITSRTINGRPGICVSFLWAFAPGQRIANGAPTCYIASRGGGHPRAPDVEDSRLHLGLGGYERGDPHGDGGQLWA